MKVESEVLILTLCLPKAYLYWQQKNSIKSISSCWWVLFRILFDWFLKWGRLFLQTIYWSLLCDYDFLFAGESQSTTKGCTVILERITVIENPLHIPLKFKSVPQIVYALLLLLMFHIINSCAEQKRSDVLLGIATDFCGIWTQDLLRANCVF